MFTAQVGKEFIVSKLQMSGLFRRMILACTTCTEMSGSGAWIIGMKIIKVHRRTEAHGLRIIRMQAGCCAAVPGTILPATAVQPLAFTSPPAVAAASLVFESFAFGRGFFFALLSLRVVVGRSDHIRALRDRFFS